MKLTIAVHRKSRDAENLTDLVFRHVGCGDAEMRLRRLYPDRERFYLTCECGLSILYNYEAEEAIRMLDIDGQPRTIPGLIAGEPPAQDIDMIKGADLV